MGNCDASDVRILVDTGLTDSSIIDLIALADGEILARKLSTVWTSANLQQLSMLLTAELVANNDTSLRNPGEYGPKGQAPEKFRKQAEHLISSLEIGFIAYTSPVP